MSDWDPPPRVRSLYPNILIFISLFDLSECPLCFSHHIRWVAFEQGPRMHSNRTRAFLLNWIIRPISFISKPNTHNGLLLHTRAGNPWAYRFDSINDLYLLCHSIRSMCVVISFDSYKAGNACARWTYKWHFKIDTSGKDCLVGESHRNFR